jgi:hypothetical protein
MDRNRIPKPGTSILTKRRRKVGRPRRTNFTLSVKEQALRLIPSEFLMMLMMIVRLRIRLEERLGKRQYGFTEIGQVLNTFGPK